MSTWMEIHSSEDKAWCSQRDVFEFGPSHSTPHPLTFRTNICRSCWNLKSSSALHINTETSAFSLSRMETKASTVSSSSLTSSTTGARYMSTFFMENLPCMTSVYRSNSRNERFEVSTALSCS